VASKALTIPTLLSSSTNAESATVNTPILKRSLRLDQGDGRLRRRLLTGMAVREVEGRGKGGEGGWLHCACALPFWGWRGVLFVLLL
jgi:hypothetical protein